MGGRSSKIAGSPSADVETPSPTYHEPLPLVLFDFQAAKSTANFSGNNLKTRKRRLLSQCSQQKPHLVIFSSPLHAAALLGDLSSTATLAAAEPASVLSKDQQQRTPLHHAAAMGHCQLVQQLLAHGADSAAADKHGSTALHLAVQCGCLSTVQALLRSGAAVNAQDLCGCTALHYAAVRGLGLVVRLLLNAGADVTAREQLQLSTPLHCAAAWGHVAAVRRLAYASAAATSSFGTAAAPVPRLGEGAVAGAKGKRAGGKGRLGRRPDAAAGEEAAAAGGEGLREHKMIDAVDVHYKTALFLAAERGQLQVVEALIAAGADVESPDLKGLVPLHAAASQGHWGVIKALAAARPTYQHLNAARNLGGMTPLCCAAAGGHVGAVKALVAAGAALQLPGGAKGWAPMLFAAEHGHAGVVKVLLAAGVRVDKEVLTYQRTPLYAAVVRGRGEVVQLLLEAGASIGTQGVEHAQVVDRLGDSGGVLYFGTLLHYSVYWKYRDACETLLGNGVCVDVRDRKQQTPLHLAASGDACDCIEYVQLLLGAGADPNAQDAYGRTPLHVAVRGGDTAIVQALLAAGAEGGLEDENGDSPLGVAIARKHMRSAYELLLAGGSAEELEGMEAEALQEQLLKHLRKEEGGLKQKVQLFRTVRYNLRLLLLRLGAAGKFTREIMGVGLSSSAAAAAASGDGASASACVGSAASSSGLRVQSSVAGARAGSSSSDPYAASSSSGGGGAAAAVPGDGGGGVDAGVPALVEGGTWLEEVKELVRGIGWLRGEVMRLEKVGPELQEVIVSVAEGFLCTMAL